jgi:hypothetical protein
MSDVQTIKDEIARLEQLAQSESIDLMAEEITDARALAIQKAIAERQAIVNFHEDPVRAESEKLEAELAGFAEWKADTDYSPGDRVIHNGIRYQAMNDVQRGIAPDDQFDLDAGTGGWAEV